MKAVDPLLHAAMTTSSPSEHTMRDEDLGP